ncbi:MAG TPA: hypothetical protein VIO60_02540 [Rectinemataceae bacterium]
MKKFVLVSLFALVGLGMVSAASSGTLDLSATASSVLELTLPGDFTGTIDDNSAGTVNTWNIGNVVVKSNHTGWTISISSANAGLLKNGSVDSIDYKMTLGSLVTNNELSSTWTSSAQGKTPKAGTSYALSISFTPSTTTYFAQGTYTDTLTVTLTGN